MLSYHKYEPDLNDAGRHSSAKPFCVGDECRVSVNPTPCLSISYPRVCPCQGEQRSGRPLQVLHLVQHSYRLNEKKKKIICYKSYINKKEKKSKKHRYGGCYAVYLVGVACLL